MSINKKKVYQNNIIHLYILEYSKILQNEFYFILFLLLKNKFYVKIMIGDDMKEKNKVVEQEFLDINKENKYKDYIIVGILYVIVIILCVFLVLGIKNQKEEIKNNINDNNQTVEDNKTKNDIDMPDEKAEENNIEIDDNNLKKEETPKLEEGKKENNTSNNFFENLSSNIQQMNEDKKNELDIMNQIP